MNEKIEKGERIMMFAKELVMCLLLSIMSETILEIEFLTIDLHRVDFIFSIKF